MAKKIGEIRIVHGTDNDPDLSYLGTYTDSLTDGIIVRKYGQFYEDLSEIEEIPTKSTEYRGFKPSNMRESENDPNYKKYAIQDYERMEQINNGNVGFICISAEAEVLTSTDRKNWLINTLSSGGLYGIESDSDNSYIESVEKEELDQLKEVLKEYGFTEKQINKSFENISNKEV
jgi:hypothetical protein